MHCNLHGARACGFGGSEVRASGGWAGSRCCSVLQLPPKKRPEELLCFFGTKDASRRTAIAHCHAKVKFGVGTDAARRIESDAG